MKKTYEEILEILKSELSVENLAFHEFPENWYGKRENGDIDYSQWIHPELGTVVEVDEYGGEGQGEQWYTVLHFVDQDVYIRVDGFYTSFNGTDFYDGWNCCSNVQPITKTITVYE